MMHSDNSRRLIVAYSTLLLCFSVALLTWRVLLVESLIDVQQKACSTVIGENHQMLDFLTIQQENREKEHVEVLRLLRKLADEETP